MSDARKRPYSPSTSRFNLNLGDIDTYQKDAPAPDGNAFERGVTARYLNIQRLVV
jgi:hypothetical protein